MAERYFTPIISRYFIAERYLSPSFISYKQVVERGHSAFVLKVSKFLILYDVSETKQLDLGKGEGHSRNWKIEEKIH